MKRYIVATTQNETQQILQVLQEHGIDTTKMQYELKAEKFTKYEDGPAYVRRFVCPGNYLAYFSMYFKHGPSPKEMLYYMNIEDFEDIVNRYPQIEKFAKEAGKCWWGDGDDFIVYLKNLTTGQIMFKGTRGARYKESRDIIW